MALQSASCELINREQNRCVMPASLQMNYKHFHKLNLVELKELIICSAVSMTMVAHLQSVQSLWGQLQ